MADETSPAPSLKAAWQTQIILFGALAMATMMYGVVLFVVMSQQPDGPTPPGILLPVFGVVALGLLGGSFVMRQKMMPQLASDDAEIRSIDGVEMTPPRRAALAKLQTANLLSWALVEAIAAFGFVLAFLTHDINQFFPFLAGAALGFAVHRPQQQQLLRAIAAAR